MKLENKATILICTSDSYEDLWYPFFELYETYWGNKNIEIVLNTESKLIKNSIYNIKQYPLKGNDLSSYGSRMIHNIKQIKNNYTILLLDDFFIRTPVNEDLLIEYIQIMEEDPSITTINFDFNLSGEPYNRSNKLKVRKKIDDYKLNMQGAIWRTEKLLKYWNKNDSPWTWELYGNYQSFNDEKFLVISNEKFNPINYGYNQEGMGVFRGKWVLEDVEPLFLDHNINIDLSKRGIYNKKRNDLKINKFSLIPYLFDRLGVRYFCSFVLFKSIKKIGFFKEYTNHVHYLNKK